MGSSYKVILYWLLFFIVGFGMYFTNIPEYIAKKTLALYLIVGVIISFKFKITIFKKGKFTDSLGHLDDTSIFANISILILSLYIIFFD